MKFHLVERMEDVLELALGLRPKKPLVPRASPLGAAPRHSIN